MIPGEGMLQVQVANWGGVAVLGRLSCETVRTWDENAHQPSVPTPKVEEAVRDGGVGVGGIEQGPDEEGDYHVRACSQVAGDASGHPPVTADVSTMHRNQFYYTHLASEYRVETRWPRQRVETPDGPVLGGGVSSEWGPRRGAI
ncbi:hypothetical protein HJFPF1_01842 [Paramyrothecium foliicola]|nr:hypothetical protein HJFPF1_01842 [Paramyrothecium foliicola]